MFIRAINALITGALLADLIMKDIYIWQVGVIVFVNLISLNIATVSEDFVQRELNELKLKHQL